MNLKKVIAARKKIRDYLIGGIIIGVVYAIAEYLIRMKTGYDPQLFIPLLIRASFIGALVTCSVLIFEILLNCWFSKSRFFFLVLLLRYV